MFLNESIGNCITTLENDEYIYRYILSKGDAWIGTDIIYAVVPLKQV